MPEITRKAALILVCICLLLVNPSPLITADLGAAQPVTSNFPPSTRSSSTDSIIYVVDSNWTSSSVTSDCALGWANHEWHLILSQARLVRIQVDDCCCPGDYYSIYVNENLLGTTPKPEVWGCDLTGTLSSGVFEIVLPAGTHVIKVRDVSFPEHTLTEIADQRMCPAGFTMYGTLLTPPLAPDIVLDQNSWEFENNTAPFLPEKFWVSIRARNIGAAMADNVVVRFYRGNPDQGGSQIGSDQVLGSIAVGGQAEATVEWTLSGNVDNETLYATASVASDLDTRNNTVKQPVGVWYVPFQHNDDAYSFENWSLEWEDAKADLLMFLDLNHPDDMGLALMLPIIYPLWAMLTESGGHCYGMSATSGLYYEYPGIKPVVKDTYDMLKEEASSDIRYYQRHQTPHVFEMIIADTFGYNAANQYDLALDSIRDGKPIMLLMKGNNPVTNKEGGHAVLAYKVLDLGNEKRLYLYDNNLPLNRMSSSPYAVIDYGSRTFLYDSPYTWNFQRVLAREPLMSTPDWAEVIVERLYNWAIKQILESDLIRVVVGPSSGSWQASRTPLQSELLAEPLITDQYGRSIGYVSGSLVNEIPGATLTALGDQIVLDLPSDLQYVVGITGIESGSLALSFLVPEDPVVVRQVAYLDVPVSVGSSASVNLGQANSDWTLTNTEQPPEQPDWLEEHHFYTLLVPLATRNWEPCDGQIIINPGFEQWSGVGWTTSSSNGRDLITSSLPISPHGGSRAAWLGHDNGEVSLLTQTITPPADASTAMLTYWYWISSEESGCAYDHAWLELNGGMLRLYNLCSVGNTYGWSQDTIDLTPYLGQPITLQFHVDTDSSITSSFFVDDATLFVQCDD